MWSGFQAKKVNTYGEFELDHAQNQAEPENQAGLVPGPDLDQMKNCENFFQKTKSASMPAQHVKWQPAVSKYVKEKWGVKIVMDLRTPCMFQKLSLTFSRLYIVLVENLWILHATYSKPIRRCSCL